MAWPNGYAYRIECVVASGQITGTLTDFPARLSLSNSLLATVGNGGAVQNTVTQTVGSRNLTCPADFFVTSDSSGSTQITGVEFESYSATVGTAEVWVKVAGAAVGSTVYVWFGNASVTTLQGTPSDTWNSNYALVAHLPDGTTLDLSDSTSNALTLLSNSASATAGEIDGGVAFTSAGSSYVSTNQLDQGYPQSWQVWLKTSSPGAILGSQNGIPAAGINNAIYLSSVDGTILGGTYNGIPAPLVSSTVCTDDAWHLCHYTTDDVTQTLYIDGVSVASAAAGGYFADLYYSIGYASTAGWPNGNDTDYYFDGSMDEFRLTSDVLTADWIAADFANHSAPNTFWTVSAPDSGTTTNSQTQPAVARIQVTSNQTQSGVSRIQIVSTHTQSGRSRIQATTAHTITGLSRIQVTSTETQTGKSRIQQTTTQTQSGVARVQATSSQTQPAISRVQVTSSGTQTGIAKIVVTGTSSATQTGTARIQAAISSNQSGISRIEVTSDHTQPATARIGVIGSQTQTGTGRIRVVSFQAHIGTCRIQSTRSHTITGAARISDGTIVITPWSRKKRVPLENRIQRIPVDRRIVAIPFENRIVRVQINRSVGNNFQRYTKDPDAEKDYGWDLTDWLAGDTIQTVDWTVPPGITKTNETNTTTEVIVWLSGGTLSKTYSVECVYVTVGNRTDKKSLKCTSKTSNK